MPEYNSLSRGKFENKDCGGSEYESGKRHQRADEVEQSDFAVDSRIEFGGNARRRITQRDEQEGQIYHC